MNIEIPEPFLTEARYLLAHFREAGLQRPDLWKRIENWLDAYDKLTALPSGAALGAPATPLVSNPPTPDHSAKDPD